MANMVTEFIIDRTYLGLNLSSQLLHCQNLFGRFLRSSESSRPLLIHLGTRGDPVVCHVKQLPRPHDGEQSVDALEDGDHHLVLVLGGWPTNQLRLSIKSHSSIVCPIFARVRLKVSCAGTRSKYRRSNEHLLVFRMCARMDDSVHV